MSLRVYGIVMHDGNAAPRVPAGLQLHPLREIAAVAEDGDYSSRVVEPPDIERHLQIVADLFRQDAVLPTPVHTVFRSAEVLQRWMDLHYVALSDALAWIEDRLAARVHISRAHVAGDDQALSADLAAVAAEVIRSLRRHAVASVPIRETERDVEAPAVATLVTSAGFLVERELWTEFAEAVADEQNRHDALSVQLTGPWPPYDFVRLQFGA